MLVGVTNVLILPFFSMPSGHRHVAQALQAQLQLSPCQADIQTVDLFHRAYGPLERWCGTFYLHWITHLPATYRRLYRLLTEQSGRPSAGFQHVYKALFLPTLQRVLEAFDPDVIFCTHSLPSYLCGELRKTGLLRARLVNVYTDFFIHSQWADTTADVHLLPDESTAGPLRNRRVAAHTMIACGIPLDPAFAHGQHAPLQRDRPLVLIAGGHAGLGDLRHLIRHLQPTGAIDYVVLCGTNRTLFNELQDAGNPYLRPLGYLADKQTLNEWYNQASALLTKAGGVTLSEGLRKALPMLIYSALPGQEEWNVRHLTQLKLAGVVRPGVAVESQLVPLLHDTAQRRTLVTDLQRYQSALCKLDIASICK
jgi:processive 1,2-diacylglycerol beta-glucosyltransferase